MLRGLPDDKEARAMPVKQKTRHGQSFTRWKRGYCADTTAIYTYWPKLMPLFVAVLARYRRPTSIVYTYIHIYLYRYYVYRNYVLLRCQNPMSQNLPMWHRAILYPEIRRFKINWVTSRILPWWVFYTYIFYPYYLYTWYVYMYLYIDICIVQYAVYIV